ncbi:MAG: aspartate aminotransferase family protein, partial [Telluria sp.]
SCGLVAGLNLVRKKAERIHYCDLFDGDLGVGTICRGYMFDNGVIMRAVGERMIIAPPLVITRAEIDDMIGRIRLALDDTLAELRRRGLVE